MADALEDLAHACSKLNRPIVFRILSKNDFCRKNIDMIKLAHDTFEKITNDRLSTISSEGNYNEIELAVELNHDRIYDEIYINFTNILMDIVVYDIKNGYSYTEDQLKPYMNRIGVDRYLCVMEYISKPGQAQLTKSAR